MAQPQICFTGFRYADKQQLKELAKSHNWIVRESVTKRLNFLCCGYNAGRKKLERAKAQHVITIDVEQFEQALSLFE